MLPLGFDHFSEVSLFLFLHFTPFQVSISNILTFHESMKCLFLVNNQKGDRRYIKDSSNLRREITKDILA